MYRFMIGSDFHFPAQDDKAIDLWFQVMSYWKPHEIDLLGDISDGHDYSRHVTGGTSEFFNKYDIPKNEDKEYDLDAVIEQIMENEAPAREFIARNRKARKNATLLVFEGNHDYVRIQSYFDKYYPQVLEHISPQMVYGLDKAHAHYHSYDEVPCVRHGDLYLHHGNMTGTTASDSVKKHMDAFAVSMVVGHAHRMGQVNKSLPLRGEVLRGYENGHMSNIHHPYMNYTNNKNWQQGFIIGEVDDNNYAHVQQVMITPDYTCMAGNKIFHAS